MDHEDYGQTGRLFNHKQSVNRRNVDETFRPHKSWRQPTWSGNSPHVELMSLCDMAAARGVIVSGEVLRAINIQRSHDNYLGTIAVAKTRWLTTSKLM